MERRQHKRIGGGRGARAAAGHAAVLPTPAMTPSRYAGSVSRSRSHGNGLHLAGGQLPATFFAVHESAPGPLLPMSRRPQCPELVEADMGVVLR
jgi:hypothetical protein